MNLALLTNQPLLTQSSEQTIADDTNAAVSVASWTGADLAMSVKERKTELRKYMNSILNELKPDEIERQSRIVTKKVLQHPKYIEAKSVSLYLSFDEEINTKELLRDALQSGKICYIPRFKRGAKEMEMIQLYSLEDYYNLPVNKYNIKQPSNDEQRPSVFEAGTLDVVLNPGLAFTKTGKRLGRGKGYYDKFLCKCARELVARPTTLALAFREQIVTDIPTTDTDVMMDCVLYEESDI